MMNRDQKMMALVIQRYMHRKFGRGYNKTHMAELANVDIVMDVSGIIRVFDKNGTKWLSFTKDRRVLSWECTDDQVYIVLDDMQYSVNKETIVQTAEAVKTDNSWVLILLKAILVLLVLSFFL